MFNLFELLTLYLTGVFFAAWVFKSFADAGKLNDSHLAASLVSWFILFTIFHAIITGYRDVKKDKQQDNTKPTPPQIPPPPPPVEESENEAAELLPIDGSESRPYVCVEEVYTNAADCLSQCTECKTIQTELKKQIEDEI